MAGNVWLLKLAQKVLKQSSTTAHKKNERGERMCCYFEAHKLRLTGVLWCASSLTRTCTLLPVAVPAAATAAATVVAAKWL